MTRRRTSADRANEQQQLTPIIRPIPASDVLRQIAILQDASTADLKRRWRELFGKEPPLSNRSFLQSRLIYRIQALVHGGLSAETVSRLKSMGERLDGGNVVLRRIRADDRPLAGTKLMREHRGVQHVVTVRADDFEYDGKPYRSLSAIARDITKTRWNGWTFFGLNRRRGGR